MNVRPQRTLAGCALVVLTVLAYANTYQAGLVLDNAAVILADPRLHAGSLRELGPIFTEDYWWPNFTTDLYRPLTTLSYWVNYTVLRNAESPLGYHVENVALHVANVLLLWNLALKVGFSRGAAWIGAGIFAVHPLGVEAVTNIVGRADLLATLGILGASLAWWAGEQATGPSQIRRWRVTAGTIAFLTVFAKESGVMAVAAIGLLIVCQRGWRQAPAYFFRNALRYLAAALLATIVVRWAMHRHSPGYYESFPDNPLIYLGRSSAFMTAVTVLGRYAWLCVWPATLSCDYSYAQVPLFGRSTGGTLEAIIALLVFGAAGFWLWRKRDRVPLVVAALAWSAVMMLPTSNLVVKIGAIMAERFLYLPLTGLALAATVLIEGRMPRLGPPRWVTPALAAAVLAGLSVRTFVRNRDWHDERMLWTAAVEAAPASFKVHKGLAGALIAGDNITEAQIDAAIARANVGLKILDSPPLPLEQQDNSLITDVGGYHRMKADMLAARGEVVAARDWYGHALALLDRAFVCDRASNARQQGVLRAAGVSAHDLVDKGDPRLMAQRAMTQLALGRNKDALETIRVLRGIEPLSVEALLMLGHIERASGSSESAAVRFLEVTLIAPNNPVATHALPEIYRDLGLLGALRKDAAGRVILDVHSPRVIAQINTAFVDMVKTLRAANRTAVAEQWVERAMRQFGCPAGLFKN